MSKPKPAPVTPTVKVILADLLSTELRCILAKLDQAAKLGEGGHPDMHIWNRQAREDLHDLLAEVSE